MSYTVHFKKTTCTYRSYDTAMFYAIDYIVLKLYSMQEDLLCGNGNIYIKQYFYTIIDLIANKEYEKALKYNICEGAMPYPYIVEDFVYCYNNIKKSNYIISDELINFANKLKKEVVFQ